MPVKLRYNHPRYTLVSHLFRKYLVSNNLDTEEAEYATIKQFYDWVQTYKEENLDDVFPDKTELQQVYEIDDESFEFVAGLFDSPFDACANLYSWWPIITLSARPPLTSKVLAISLAVSVVYDDGLSAHYSLPIGPQSEDFTDGLVSSIWRGQIIQVGQLLRAEGLERIHEKVKNSGKTIASLELESKQSSPDGIVENDANNSDDSTG